MARRSRLIYWDIALDGRELPVPCEYCDELVLDFHGSNGDELSGEVHHVDNNPGNNERSNLMIVHHSCHTAIHFKGVSKSEAHRQALSNTWTDERREQQAARNRETWTGRKHHPEIVEKMRGPRKRVVCYDCKKEYALNWINRHKTEGRCVS